MSNEFFQDSYHIDTTFVEFYGIISAMPRHWRHLINTCHNLIYKRTGVFISYRLTHNTVNIVIDSLLLKSTVIPVNSINKWST